MSNQLLINAVAALSDALVDSAALIKNASIANSEEAGAAILSDADLKAKVGALIVGGLSGIEAALKDLANVADDLDLVMNAVPMVEKVIAALKA